tara:strand:+ start:85 stop:435 length:351 start_codon:yes stop_codon:yes gene_type:complete
MDGIPGLLRFLLEGIEYAERPHNQSVYRYVYGRNLIQEIASKALRLSRTASGADLELLQRMQSLLRGEMRRALQWKAFLKPHEVQLHDILLDQCARDTVDLFDTQMRWLLLVHGCK